MDNNQSAQDQVVDNATEGTEGVEEVKHQDTVGDSQAPVDEVKEETAVGDELAEQIYGASAVLKEEPVEAPKAQEPVAIPAGQILPPAAINDVDQLPLSCSATSNLSIEELKHYIEKMNAKVRMPTDEGGQMQMNLYFTLVQIINSTAEDFEAVFGLAMKLIRDNLKGVFSDENMHRYTPHVSMPSQRVMHFRQLLSALTTLAVPETRNLAIRHNLANAFGRAPIREDARQRVLNFFNI